jgi:hypothetical protein
MKYTIRYQMRDWEGGIVRRVKYCRTRKEAEQEKEFLVTRAKAAVRVYDPAGRLVSSYNSFRQS